MRGVKSGVSRIKYPLVWEKDKGRIRYYQSGTLGLVWRCLSDHRGKIISGLSGRHLFGLTSWAGSRFHAMRASFTVSGLGHITCELSLKIINLTRNSRFVRFQIPAGLSCIGSILFSSASWLQKSLDRWKDYETSPGGQVGTGQLSEIPLWLDKNGFWQWYPWGLERINAAA